MCTLTLIITLMILLVSWKNKSVHVSSADIRKAFDKSYLLLEQSGYVFTERSALKCAGCHHTTMTAHGGRSGKKKRHFCH
ncbi:MAG: hypothetical protein WDM78_16565 [Puia sp.]